MAKSTCCLALMQTSLVWDCSGRRLCLTARQHMETARKMEFKTRGMLDTMSGEQHLTRVLYDCDVLGVAHGPPPAFPRTVRDSRSTGSCVRMRTMYTVDTGPGRVRIFTVAHALDRVRKGARAAQVRARHLVPGTHAAALAAGTCPWSWMVWTNGLCVCPPDARRSAPDLGPRAEELLHPCASAAGGPLGWRACGLSSAATAQSSWLFATNGNCMQLEFHDAAKGCLLADSTDVCVSLGARARLARPAPWRVGSTCRALQSSCRQ